MNTSKLKNWRVAVVVVMIIQLLASFISSIIVHADINHPEQVSIEYGVGTGYRFKGKKANGESFETISSPLTAVSGGNRTPVFCIEPGVPINGPSSSGYVKNPLPNMSQKAKLVSALWNQAGNNTDYQMAAQAIVWEEVNHYTTAEITDLSSGRVIDLGGIKAKMNQAIADYQKKPSFDQTTAEVTLGKSITLTDQNNSQLASFDHVVKNTANVNYQLNGNNLIITPKADSNESGELVFEKSIHAGTPVAYKKAGEQTVMAGAIDQTNQYTVKIKVQKNGDLKIVKRDKESGTLVPNTVFQLDFQGKLPNKEVATGNDGSATLKTIPHGTEVIITEKSVPAPYVIDETPMKATIKAGETIEVTSRNLRAKGQIIIDKSGKETGTNLWNEHYSLTGNQFEVHKDKPDGAIVQTMVTNEKGHAETPKSQGEALELGTYYVVESKASNGFVNTFEPIKVELTYENQTVPLVIQSVKGSNQEVTGEAILTKVDKETEEETQGSATFKNAEYTLYYGEDIGSHKLGSPVKWTDNFKPTVLKGTKSKTSVSKDAVTLTIDKNRQVSVGHLAVGKYFWLETKAPVGYTEDQTKYTFEIKKKDDAPSNAIVTEAVTGKEQVIRFGFDFFKFAQSSNGSASSGFNDLEFKLTPLEGTKEITGAKDTATTHYHEGLGFDGYGKFEMIPIGDYLFEEIEAPAGFRKIQPLEIHSRFEENKSDYRKSQYVFTITEVDQKEPIKTFKVPYEKLTDKAFTVSLNRLMLYDLPEEKDQLTSLATWEDGEKNLESLEKTKAIDTVSYKLTQTKKDWFLVSQVVDVDATKKALEKDKKAEPVLISEQFHTLGNETKEGNWEIKQELEPSRIKGKNYVLFNFLYASEKAYKDGEEPVALDNHLDNQAQMLKVVLKKSVAIKTKAHLKDGGNTFTYGDVVEMYDDVEMTHSELDGTKEAFETILVALFPNGKSEEIWKSGLIDYVVKDEVFTKTIVTEKVATGKYPKGTVFTFKEINYDQEGEINAKHNEDLQEKDQTLYPKDVEQPKTPETPDVPQEKSLPQTGEQVNSLFLVVGTVLILVTGMVYLIKKPSK